MIVSPQSAVPPWLLLAFSLPQKGASVRVSVWRKLQRYGSLPLGNSGYLLPNDPANREKFEWLAMTIRGSHGEASVLEVQSIDNCSRSQLQKNGSATREPLTINNYSGILGRVRGKVAPRTLHDCVDVFRKLYPLTSSEVLSVNRLRRA